MLPDSKAGSGMGHPSPRPVGTLGDETTRAQGSNTFCITIPLRQKKSCFGFGSAQVTVESQSLQGRQTGKDCSWDRKKRKRGDQLVPTIQWGSTVVCA